MFRPERGPHVIIIQNCYVKECHFAWCPKCLPLPFVFPYKIEVYELLTADEQLRAVAQRCCVPSFPVNRYSQSCGISYKRPQTYSTPCREDANLHVFFTLGTRWTYVISLKLGRFNPGECWVLQQNRYVTDIILFIWPGMERECSCEYVDWKPHPPGSEGGWQAKKLACEQLGQGSSWCIKNDWQGCVQTWRRPTVFH